MTLEEALQNEEVLKKLDNADTKIYSFGFLDYSKDGGATTTRIYATYNWSGTDRGTKYDTMGSTGRE